MPSSTDEVFNQESFAEDVQDLKPLSKANKKKAKKAAKTKLVDESKDSSSEGQRLSPDLAPVLRHTAPSPPPSPPLDPDPGPGPEQVLASISPLVPEEHDQVAGITSFAHDGPLVKDKARISSANVTSEPSPPQDGFLIGHDDGRRKSHLPVNFSAVPNASLSSSPQGGIRLPTAALQPFSFASSRALDPTTVPRGRAESLGRGNATSPSSHDMSPPYLAPRFFSPSPTFVSGHTKAVDRAIPAGSRGFYCGFDSLQGTSSATSPAANNVVLVGWQGGLDVYRLLRQRTDILGRLEGLRGSVIDAKILPWPNRVDHFACKRPLVALTIHGPVMDTVDQNAPVVPYSSTASDPRGTSPVESLDPKSITEYQTTVEVYSLASAEHVATLYRSPTVPLQQNVDHPSFAPPPAIGNLKIMAEGKYIVISSGSSGEVFIFSMAQQLHTGVPPIFYCIGKLWTTTRMHGCPPGVSVAERGEAAVEHHARGKFAIVGLSGRWLAISPPLLSSAQISLQGTATISPDRPEAPGLSTSVSPHPPPPDCETDAPIDNGFLSRVTKQATQELRKGAQWVGERGKQAWKAYWERPAPNATVHDAQASPRTGSHGEETFPPTHAQSVEPQNLTVEPALVSIIDLDRLFCCENSSRGSLAPLATFHLHDGCSFLSFAPDGLSLLTTNHLGYASTIWNLGKITDGKGAAQRSANGISPDSALVRLTARFPRNTPRQVMDVSWTDKGDRVAILTEKGTLHLHDLANCDFHSVVNQNARNLAHSRMTASPGSSPPQEGSTGFFMNNIQAGFQSIQGLALRSRSSSHGQNFGFPAMNTLTNASAAARNASGRAVRQGFAKGLGLAAEGADRLRHAEANKVRLRPMQHAPATDMVRWLGGKDKALIASIVDGKIIIKSVKGESHYQGKRRVVLLVAGRRAVSEIALQNIGHDMLPAAVRGAVDPSGLHAACAKEGGVHGFWTSNRSGIRKPSPPADAGFRSTIQDKETNPSYMPFHRSPQVALLNFNQASATKKAPMRQSGGEGLGCGSVWVFGQALVPTTRVTCKQLTLDQEFHQLSGGIHNEELATQGDESCGELDFRGS